MTVTDPNTNRLISISNPYHQAYMWLHAVSSATAVLKLHYSRRPCKLYKWLSYTHTCGFIEHLLLLCQD